MRSILIATTIIAQALIASVSLAQDEAYEDCRGNCTAEKQTRDMECPSPYDSTNMGKDRDDCLQSSRDLYTKCIQACPPPQTPPPSSPPPMGY